MVQKFYIRIVSLKNLILSRFLRSYYNLNPMISIGKGTYIEKGTELLPVCHWGIGKIKIGNNCFIGKGVKIIAQGGNVEIGDNSSLNPYTIVYGMGGLKIGNQVRIGPRCVIVPQNHNYSKRSVIIDHQGMTSKGVIIEDDVWLGTGVTVLDGVTVKTGSVLGGGL